MDDRYTSRLRGRQREAERNDARLLRAAGEVFAELGWDAPVSAIARRAGIGMGSLYRRYPSKELLAQRLRIAGMEQLVAQARTALAEEPEPWAAFARFLREAVSAQGAGEALLPLVCGRIPATDEIRAAAARLRASLDDLVGGAHRAGVLRTDFTSADIPLLLEHLTTRMPTTTDRATALRLRYLDLVLAGLRTSAADTPASLHGPAPHWTELSELWNAPES